MFVCDAHRIAWRSKSTDTIRRIVLLNMKTLSRCISHRAANCLVLCSLSPNSMQATLSGLPDLVSANITVDMEGQAAACIDYSTVNTSILIGMAYGNYPLHVSMQKVTLAMKTVLSCNFIIEMLRVAINGCHAHGRVHEDSFLPERLDWYKIFQSIPLPQQQDLACVARVGRTHCGLSKSTK